jgi:hypothetical protein
LTGQCRTILSATPLAEVFSQKSLGKHEDGTEKVSVSLLFFDK